MLVLSGKEIESCLTYNDVMNCVEEAFQAYEEKKFIMPDRTTLECGSGNSLLLMPSVASGALATKILTLFPGNHSLNKPTINGVVVLNDPSTGEVLSIMDAKTITAFRTGAVTGVSIRYLAKENADSVGLIGCGVQGFYQAVYACTARNIKKVRVFDASETAAIKVAQGISRTFPEMAVEVPKSIEDLVRESEIVITATTSQIPIIKDDPELFKGKHFVAIGSFQPNVRELPDALFSVLEKVWIDTDFATEESGELIIPLKEGKLKIEQIERLSHLIQSGNKPDRGTHGTTFFKSVGMSLFDLFTAKLAYRKASEKRIGTDVSL